MSLTSNASGATLRRAINDELCFSIVVQHVPDQYTRLCHCKKAPVMRFLSFLLPRKLRPAEVLPRRDTPRPVKSLTVSDILAGRGGSDFRVERSPDGRSAIVIASLSMRMSHSVDHAALYALPDERLVTEIGNSLWSADRIVWTDEGRGVAIDLRRYPGDVAGVSVTIDISRGLARIGAAAPLSLSDLSAALEASYWAQGGRG
jgi:hypothetical protein